MKHIFSLLSYSTTFQASHKKYANPIKSQPWSLQSKESLCEYGISRHLIELTRKIEQFLN